MPETQRNETDETSAYTPPTISDYGDLVEMTAAGGKGTHVDATYTIGETAGYLSSAP